MLFPEDIFFLRSKSAVLFQFRPSGKKKIYIEKDREKKKTNPETTCGHTLEFLQKRSD